MRLHLIRGLLDSASIIQYADCIAAGIRRYRPDIQVAEIQPPSPSRLPIGRAGRGLATQAIRFVWYPLRARKIGDGVNHITDHVHAYLLDHLDARCSVVTCHDLTPFVHPENITSTSLFPSITSKIFRHSISRLHKAACVIAVSENTKKDILTYSRCTVDQVRVVYHGLDPLFNENADREKVIAFRRKFAPDRSRLLLHVGLNAPYKNVETVFRILRALIDRGNAVRLIKVGEQFTAAQLKLSEDLRLTKQIVHLGRLDAANLVVCYQSCDVLVFPSIYEGFGWPPLEAMACGTPVVSSATGATPEIVGNAAILHDPADVPTLADSVAALLNNENLRKDYILAGARRAKTFTWQRSISELACVYDEISKRATSQRY